jgi:hypothetical protein
MAISIYLHRCNYWVSTNTSFRFLLSFCRSSGERDANGAGESWNASSHVTVPLHARGTTPCNQNEASETAELKPFYVRTKIKNAEYLRRPWDLLSWQNSFVGISHILDEGANNISVVGQVARTEETSILFSKTQASCGNKAEVCRQFNIFHINYEASHCAASSSSVTSSQLIPVPN